VVVDVAVEVAAVDEVRHGTDDAREPGRSAPERAKLSTSARRAAFRPVVRNTAAMRMTFGAQDEDAYHRRRDELGEGFAQWLDDHAVPGDPNDAGLLMDWKWGYADGRLDHWSVRDVDEFLLEWCPRKVLAPPETCAEIPVSVAAFVEYLAETGLLAPGSAAPAAVREHCERNADDFVRAMGAPAFGAGDAEVPQIPPVRIPAEDERRAAARAAPVMQKLRGLAEYCAPPGRPLTSNGNLQLADARHLVAALDTGDDATGIRSARQLPGLDRLVHLAVEGGAVRRRGSRLVGVDRFAGLDECAAHEKVALAAVAAGPRESFLGSFAEFDTVAHTWTIALLVELLRHGSEGVEPGVVDEMVGSFVEAVAPGLSEFVTSAVAELAYGQLDELHELGVLGPGPQNVALTAAGVPVAVELLRQAGFDVPIRPEPAGADVTDIVDLFRHLGDEELQRDVDQWLAARPDRRAAAAELAAEGLAAHRDTVTAMIGIALVGRFAADHAADVLRPHVDGPHGGLVLQWLIDKGAIDPGSVDPARLAAGLVDFLAVGLDMAGPEEVVSVLGNGAPDGGVGIIDGISWLDHPRLADVLDAVAGHHPDPSVAKVARKALMKLRSRST